MKLLGLLMIVGGICLGLYVGGYLMLVGGVIQVIEGAKNDIDALMIAWGVGKVVLASFVGTITAFVLVIPGMAFLSS